LSSDDSAGVATRHRAGEPTRRLSSSWPLRWASPILLLPFPFLAPHGAHEWSRATTHRRSPCRPSIVAPPPFPCASNPTEAPPPHPPPPPPLPEPVRTVPLTESALRRPAAIVGRWSSTPPIELPLPALLSSIRAHGEVPRDLLLLPIPFPAQIPRRRCRNAAAPSWSPGCAAGARRGLLLREPGRPRRAPWGRGAPLAAVLRCPAAALAHSQQTRHATPPAMALVAMAWLCCPFGTVVLSCEFVSFHVKLAKYIKK